MIPDSQKILYREQSLIQIRLKYYWKSQLNLSTNLDL